MFTAYRVGVELVLKNEASRPLALFSAELRKADENVKVLKRSLSQLKLSIPTAAGGNDRPSMLDGAKAAVKSATEFGGAATRFNAQNLGKDYNAKAIEAVRSANTYGVTFRDYLDIITDLTRTLHSFDKAKDLAPLVANMAFANSAVFGEHGRKFDDMQRGALGRVTEMRGGFKSDAELKTQADMMQHAMSSTQDEVMPTDYSDLLEAGGAAAKKLGNEAFFYGMTPLMQEMGARKVGEELQGAYSRFILGEGADKPSAQAAFKQLENIGIMGKSKLVTDRATGATHLQPGYLKDQDLFTSNPLKWLTDDLVPALRKAGYKTDQQLSGAIEAIFGEKGGALYSTMLPERGEIAESIEAEKKAPGIAELNELAKNSPAGAFAALGAAFENLKIAVGDSVMPIIIPGVNLLTRWLGGLSKAMERHHWIAYGLAIGGALKVVAGAVRTVVKTTTETIDDFRLLKHVAKKIGQVTWRTFAKTGEITSSAWSGIRGLWKTAAAEAAAAGETAMASGAAGSAEVVTGGAVAAGAEGTAATVGIAGAAGGTALLGTASAALPVIAVGAGVAALGFGAYQFAKDPDLGALLASRAAATEAGLDTSDYDREIDGINAIHRFGPIDDHQAGADRFFATDDLRGRSVDRDRASQVAGPSFFEGLLDRFEKLVASVSVMTVQLDGRIVGRMVSGHIARDHGGPSSDNSYFDGAAGYSTP
jgi:hypothetical protein